MLRPRVVVTAVLVDSIIIDRHGLRRSQAPRGQASLEILGRLPYNTLHTVSLEHRIRCE